MMRVISALVKIGLASLITGAVLSALNLSAAELLAEIGLTPDRVFTALQEGAAWAIPNIVLGSMVIVPIWFRHLSAAAAPELTASGLRDPLICGRTLPVHRAAA